MNENFIHSCSKLPAKKDGKHCLPTTVKEQKCNRRLIWTCCFWFNWKLWIRNFF